MAGPEFSSKSDQPAVENPSRRERIRALVEQYGEQAVIQAFDSIDQRLGQVLRASVDQLSGPNELLPLQDIEQYPENQ